MIKTIAAIALAAALPLGGWHAEPRHDHVITAPAETEQHSSRYEAVSIDEADIDLLARVVFLEANTEPREGQQAVAEVILNRVASERFPATVREVIYQYGQFSTAPFISTATPCETNYEAVRAALDGDPVIDDDVLFFAQGPVTSDVACTIGNHVFCR